MPQSLTSPRPLPFVSASSGWSGRRALVVAAVVLVVALGSGWLATRALAPAPQPQKSAQARLGLENVALDRLDISGFQKRGSLLVGETETDKGVRLRLVLDARTRELVGLRVIENEAGER